MRRDLMSNFERWKEGNNSSFDGPANPSESQNYQWIRAMSYLPEIECEKNQIHIV